MNFVSKHRIFRRALLIGATISLVLTLSSADVQAAETFTWGGATFTYAEPLRPCEPTIAPCDVTIHVENDHGLPMEAKIVFPDADPYSNPGSSVQRTDGNKLHLNFSEASFYLMIDGRRPKRGPFKYPIPNMSFPASIEDASHSIQPGDRVLITRSSESYRFPEADGNELILNPGHLQVTLPSFFPKYKPEPSVGARALLGMINDERAKQGLEYVSFAAGLTAAAQGYADWNCNNSDKPVSHDRYGTPSTRAVDMGWPESIVGENLAWGISLAEEAFGIWMESEGHKTNMLSQKYRFAGIGHGKCGFTVLKLAPEPKTPVEITDDTGDSSLSRLRDRPRDPETRKTRFAPRFILKKARARNPVLTIRTGQAKGRFAVRYRKRVIRGSRKVYRLRVGKRGRITIRYTANNKSRVKSGVAARCLKTKKGRVRLTRC